MYCYILYRGNQIVNYFLITQVINFKLTLIISEVTKIIALPYIMKYCTPSVTMKYFVIYIYYIFKCFNLLKMITKLIQTTVDLAQCKHIKLLTQ